MIRSVVVSRFKKFRLLECDLRESAVIAGPSNSGKTALLQALATWAELGEVWLQRNAELAPQDYHRVELGIADLRSMALSSFDQLWHNQDTKEPISIKITADDWDVGFDLQYHDAATTTVGPSENMPEENLEACAYNPLKTLFVPSLSGMDVHEPEYKESVLATRLARGKGGTVIRTLVLEASRDRAKWAAFQKTVESFFWV